MTPVKRACAAAVLCTAATLPASAAPASCDGAVARLTSDKGQSFIAARYGFGDYLARTGRGRLTHTVHVWRGKVGEETRFLHFTEIPSVSGPNWGSAARLSAYRAKIGWKTASTFRLPEKFVVYAGPLKGEWTTTCDTAQP